MNLNFHGFNFYSKQPQKIFEFYKALGFRVVQEKESDDYFGAALARMLSFLPFLRMSFSILISTSRSILTSCIFSPLSVMEWLEGSEERDWMSL